jgi:hypothetical protein
MWGLFYYTLLCYKYGTKDVSDIPLSISNIFKTMGLTVRVVD